MALTTSRDGRHWSRVANREAFIPLGGEKDWDSDYPEPASPPLLVGDKIWIYYRSSSTAQRRSRQCIGLATLRRDGFVSLNAGPEGGRIVTRPLTFNGARLFVNAKVSPGGHLRVGVLSRSRAAVPGYALEDCRPITGDAPAARIRWGKQETAPRRPDQSVRLVFEIKNAKLYSFWIE